MATTEDFMTYSGNAEPLSQKAFSAGLVTTLKDLAAPGQASHPSRGYPVPEQSRADLSCGS